MKTTTSSSRLFAYGTLTCGTTALLSGNVEAATVVPINASSYDTGLSNFGTISSSVQTGGEMDKAYVAFSGTGVSFPNGSSFRRASDTSPATVQAASSTQFAFIDGAAPKGSSELNSSDNWFYAVGSQDPTQRMWLQFHFGDSMNEDFSVVAALVLDAGETIDNPAAAAAAVPETSSLALLSLGAASLLKRRRRAA
jgi:hypothetical protein